MTDSDGDYVIGDMVYGDAGYDFVFEPMLEGHGFDPATLTETLSGLSGQDVQTGVNFIDTTTYSISGTVTLPGTGGSMCALEGATITVDDGTSPIPLTTNTDENGNWSYSVQELQDYTISISYEDHTFSPSSRTISLQDDSSGVDFEDITQRSVSLSLLGGCDNRVATTMTYQVSAQGAAGCFDTTFTVSDVEITLSLPPLIYQVEVTDIDPLDDDILTQLSAVSLNLDSAGTDSSSARFIYHQPPRIQVFAN